MNAQQPQETAVTYEIYIVHPDGTEEVYARTTVSSDAGKLCYLANRNHEGVARVREVK